MAAPVDHTVLPSEEKDDLRTLQSLARVLASDGPVILSLAGSEEVRIPDSVRILLQQVVDALGEQKAVTLSEQNTLLTTQEAAELLGVSRPTVVRLLKTNAIPYTQPNRHRRIRLQDLLEYQRQASARRREVLDEMTKEAQDGNMYRTVNGFVTTR
ncbi:helix-turn-helix domain-containing protein [Gordonia sp. LSe1-13]|uniref:Helix-turn-helix domain-containing protein n=1 Tax=Gordonia sesuvii TaxID=3116777 RepID=A0ABU7M7Y8_9ACTN|nr:helix-turn-helix domain-containing protein [Gordonia sp. LSe1-13]